MVRFYIIVCHLDISVISLIHPSLVKKDVIIDDDELEIDCLFKQ